MHWNTQGKLASGAIPMASLIARPAKLTRTATGSIHYHAMEE